MIIIIVIIIIILMIIKHDRNNGKDYKLKKEKSDKN